MLFGTNTACAIWRRISTFLLFGKYTITYHRTAESALAHKVPGVEGGYFRSDLFQRRHWLMDSWAGYLSATPVRVVHTISEKIVLTWRIGSHRISVGWAKE